MPMYIDRHDAPGISPEEVAAGHELDLAIQEQFGVRYHTYWFDPSNGSVFCLAEGPSQEAVEEVHRTAHGQIAPNIIEIDVASPLNAYFGSLPTHATDRASTAPAMRAIVFTDVCGSVAQTQQLGDDGHMELLREHNEIVRGELATHDGREVKHTGDGIMAAFTSVAAAVAFSVAVQQALAERKQQAANPIHLSIGISAGEPVTDDNDDLFGAAVQLAARLCDAAPPGEIAVSVAVKELCMGKPIRFEDRGHVPIKGLSEPAQAYAVSWRE
jgi:class 3 adenylate cyclase